MPLDLAFQEPSTFVIRASGNVTFDESQRMIDQLRDDPRVRADVGVYVDGRDVESAPTTMELRILAGDLKPVFDQGIGAMAIVADKTFVYGIARMFQAFAEALGENVHAFRSPDEARDWLTDQTKHAA